MLYSIGALLVANFQVELKNGPKHDSKAIF